MASSLSTSQLALLRRLATKEAARRQQDASNTRQPQTTSAPAGQSSVTLEDVQQLEADTKRLGQVLREERARNDVAWAEVQMTLKALDPPPSSISHKEQELALLEHDIATMSAGLSVLDPPLDDFTLCVLTRSLIADSIEQHEFCLHQKRSTLAREQNMLLRDEEIYRQLQDVRTGLETRQRRLSEKEEQEKDDRSGALRSLQQKVQQAEESLGRFLTSLIEISNELFDDADADKREQLKHLTDRLVNAAWDYPDNPWVHIDQQYYSSIVTFLIRANVAFEHPRDARMLRLVDFHR